MFSASESVVKKHVIFYVFLLFYLFIPLLLLANIIQENFREKTHSIETERGTKKLRAHPQRGGVGLRFAVLVHLRQVHPLRNTELALLSCRLI